MATIMRRRIILAYCLGASITAAPLTANAEPCPVQLPTDGSRESYQPRQAVRCEGTYTSPVSGGLMSVVSLTFGKVIYDLGRDRELLITVPAASADTNIIAVRLRAQHYYRLDAKLPKAQPTIRVPLQDVIARLPIPAEEFGVFGMREIAGAVAAFVPVWAGASGAAEAQGIELKIQSDVPVTDVEWRLVASTPNTTQPQWKTVDGGSGLVPRGKVLTISLGPTLPSGKSQVEIAYSINGIPRTDPFILVAP